MSTTAEVAAALYGSSTPASEPAQNAPAEQSAQSQQPKTDAEALYADAKTVDQAAQTYASFGRDIRTAAAERFGLDDAAVNESVQHWTGTLARYGVEHDAADQLVQVGISAMANEAPPETVQAWGLRARQDVKAEFGEHRAQQVIDAARQLVARDAALAAWLDSTGAGSHPAVVMALCKAAMKGKL